MTRKQPWQAGTVPEFVRPEFPRLPGATRPGRAGPEPTRPGRAQPRAAADRAEACTPVGAVPPLAAVAAGDNAATPPVGAVPRLAAPVADGSAATAPAGAVSGPPTVAADGSTDVPAVTNAVPGPATCAADGVEACAPVDAAALPAAVAAGDSAATARAFAVPQPAAAATGDTDASAPVGAVRPAATVAADGSTDVPAVTNAVPGPATCAADAADACAPADAGPWPTAAVPAPTASAPEADLLARVAITRIADPGDEVIGRALQERGATDVLRALREGEPLPGASPRRTDGYRTRSTRTDPERDLAAAHRAGGRFLIPGDPDWPGQLDDLGTERPYGLWVRGQPSLRLWALRSVAVVGARACTDYGAHMAARLGGGLARAGWVVVSGAAYGVDGMAHRSALRADGATIGVVASGVDVPYPPGNSRLIGEIAERGLLIGELPPGDHPTRSRFVLRNRVIAALTRGTVVVEARYRSGSLVTARRAARLGRVTMGVPGPCTSGLSEGVHELLRGEAMVVTDAAEVIELVGEIGADLAPVRRGPLLPRDLLDLAAARVLEALPGQGDADAEEIARTAGTTRDDTLRHLHELHALGFVERDDGRWKLVRTARDGAPRNEG